MANTDKHDRPCDPALARELQGVRVRQFYLSERYILLGRWSDRVNAIGERHKAHGARPRA